MCTVHMLLPQISTCCLHVHVNLWVCGMASIVARPALGEPLKSDLLLDLGRYDLWAGNHHMACLVGWTCILNRWAASQIHKFMAPKAAWNQLNEIWQMNRVHAIHNSESSVWHE